MNNAAIENEGKGMVYGINPHLNKFENQGLNPGCLTPPAEIGQLHWGSSNMKVVNGAAYS